MFTGIVEGTVEINDLRTAGVREAAASLTLGLGALAPEARVGDSLALDGICLTITELAGPERRARFDILGETIARTNLVDRKRGDRVNIESALRADGRFGGHFVSGHIDGTACIEALIPQGTQILLRCTAGPELLSGMIPKGSVAIDGVSLTIVELDRRAFAVALIPHTLEVTALAGRRPGQRVNIETDMIGKWVRRLAQTEPAPGLDLARLKELGYA